jgi:SPP1 gp7 family putative phage head morphogenesis protein
MAATAKDLIDGMSFKDIPDGSVPQIGTIISEGIAAGDGPDSIARNLSGLVSDSSQAYSIADTEMARAMSQVSADFYGANGVEQWDLLVESDACETCTGVAGDNPHALDEELPPYHPRCRCAMSPIVSLGGGQTAEGEGE